LPVGALELGFRAWRALVAPSCQNWPYEKGEKG
jgi:hypothetical protein